MAVVSIMTGGMRMETEPTVHGSMDLPIGIGREEERGQRDAARDQRRSSKDTPDNEEDKASAGKKRKEDAGEDRIPERMDSWKDKLVDALGLNATFDVQLREMSAGEKRVAYLFLAEYTKDSVMTEVLKELIVLDPSTLSQDAVETFLRHYVPAMQVKKTDSFNAMTEEVMAGSTAFYVEGETSVLLIDAKQYPARNPEEPVLEKVVRGSKDGLTETLLVNVGLIRRRLRDRKTRFEMMKVGLRSKTDVCLTYIEDLANPRLVEAVRDKIKKVEIDAIPLADQQLEELTVHKGWSPFPLVRYTERPDVIAAQLLGGSVCVMVDTSPSAMVLPTTFFDLIQHAEENRQNPFIGTYLRWVRFVGILMSMFLLPIWFLYAENPSIRPPWLWFVGADKTGDLPLILQFLVAEIGVDLMRLAAVHTPAPLVTAATLLSAILIGDIAVKTGLFINEVILYMAVSAIGMFATPSYELGLSNRIVRLFLLLCAYFLKVPGFVAGVTFLFLYLAMKRSFNSPYLWPLVPFNGKALLSVLLRKPLPSNLTRPSLNRPKQSRKQPSN